MTKSILVTGAAGGIGSKVVRTLASQGFKVLALDKQFDPSVQTSVADSADIFFLAYDLLDILSKPDARNMFLESARSAFRSQPLYAIIHIAAIQINGRFMDLSFDDWKQSMEINLLAPVVINKMFIDDLILSRGCIIHISSIHSKLTKAGFSAYATSKAALSGLTRAMAVELGHQVRVNAIEPAAILTPMLEAGFSENPDSLSMLEEYHPTHSIGTPQDVAQAVTFILDPANRFLNGCVLELGGGIHSRLHDPA